MSSLPPMNTDVQTVFEHYPDAARDRLMTLRQLIFDVAAETDGVGALDETLKWGQVSYLTPMTKSGSTVRIDAIDNQLGQVGMYFNCQTTLVETFRKLFGDDLTFEGNRCILFDASEALPVDVIKQCVELALTYHLSKKRRRTT